MDQRGLFFHTVRLQEEISGKSLAVLADLRGAINSEKHLDGIHRIKTNWSSRENSKAHRTKEKLSVCLSEMLRANHTLKRVAAMTQVLAQVLETERGLRGWTDDLGYHRGWVWAKLLLWFLWRSSDRVPAASILPSNLEQLSLAQHRVWENSGKPTWLGPLKTTTVHSLSAWHTSMPAFPILNFKGRKACVTC